ncbi:hypothetical protein ACFOLL_14145 [Falsochrobactrum ovis]|uniref:Uncharacterized protein n=1 Tax=Falsochrobactrum ovis TaxID=1293442 RepID=A0A364JRE1_9HYPH|nr:hypothetical protein [Falsochrobactrum ovis]RAK24634.1 hypothetical protein C7374_1305 [Falsochrobactrum ovis]
MANVLAGTFAQALHSPHKTTSSKKRPPYRSYRRRTWPRSKEIWLNGQYWYGPLKINEHRRIVDAFDVGDGMAVVEAVRQHLEGDRRKLLKKVVTI